MGVGVEARVGGRRDGPQTGIREQNLGTLEIPEIRVSSNEIVVKGEQAEPSCEIADRVFEAPLITWVRVHDFQIVSLKRIGAELLKISGSAVEANLLQVGLYVPGELPTFIYRTAVNLLICPSNSGALELADELRSRALEQRPRSSARISMLVALTIVNMSGLLSIPRHHEVRW